MDSISYIEKFCVLQESPVDTSRYLVLEECEKEMPDVPEFRGLYLCFDKSFENELKEHCLSRGASESSFEHMYRENPKELVKVQGHTQKTSFIQTVYRYAINSAGVFEFFRFKRKEPIVSEPQPTVSASAQPESPAEPRLDLGGLGEEFENFNPNPSPEVSEQEAAATIEAAPEEVVLVHQYESGPVGVKIQLSEESKQELVSEPPVNAESFDPNWDFDFGFTPSQPQANVSVQEEPETASPTPKEQVPPETNPSAEEWDGEKHQGTERASYAEHLTSERDIPVEPQESSDENPPEQTVLEDGGRVNITVRKDEGPSIQVRSFADEKEEESAEEPNFSDPHLEESSPEHLPVPVVKEMMGQIMDMRAQMERMSLIVTGKRSVSDVKILTSEEYKVMMDYLQKELDAETFRKVFMSVFGLMWRFNEKEVVSRIFEEAVIKLEEGLA